VLTETAPEIVLARSKVVTWSSFRKEDKQPTFGLLSQVSPDGRYAISTVKDRSVFVPKPDLTFSQLFFPLKGILAFYDRQTGTFEALPGADDPAYVHSNPTWSPDGKEIVFARSKAYELKYIKDESTALLSAEECREFLEGGRTFRYDLYRIPFNGGKGGTAVPIAGASNNGQSNFFGKYSPDGRWIVFCRANSFMLLQPDSELYIIPARGGKALRLGCNRKRMNSWHSWSPNGKWLVFASKANTPYTQLFLTHIDQQGDSAPPILLSQLTAPDRAANIPEFVNSPPNAIVKIREEFVNDVSYMRTAYENEKAGDVRGAMELYRKAVALNPDNADAHAFLGGLLTDQGQLQEAQRHLERALQLDSNHSVAHYNLGNALAKERRHEQAIESYERAIKLDPKNSKARNNLGVVLIGLGRIAEALQVLREAVAADPGSADAHDNLGHALSKLGRRDEAIREWLEALRLGGDLFETRRNLGIALLEEGDFDAAAEHLARAHGLNPRDVPCMLHLATAHARRGDPSAAAQVLTEAVQAARKLGRTDLERECLRRLRAYRGEHRLP
jgi:tetratricopeptide (TPR) repeat protein